MTLLACIPITGCLTLAEVATCSLTAADNTYKLDNNVNVVFEDDGSVDILTLHEASRGVQMHAHAAIGGAAGINSAQPFFPDDVRVVMALSEVLTDLSFVWQTGLESYLQLDPAVNSDKSVYGVDIEVISKPGNTKNLGYVYGVYGNADHQADGNISEIGGLTYYGSNSGGGVADVVFGLQLGAGNYGAGSVNYMYGIDLYVDGVAATETIGINIGSVQGMAIRTKRGHIVFNEDSHDDTDFRVESATDANNLVSDGSANTVQVGAATASDSAKFYVNGKISASGEVEINGDLNHDGSNIGFFATAPTTQKTVTGSRGGNAALASLLTHLAAYGLIVDGSSA